MDRSKDEGRFWTMTGDFREAAETVQYAIEAAEKGRRVIAALDATYPPTPLNVMARTINRLAELLPKDHECEPIFEQFDALGEYVQHLEDISKGSGLASTVRPLDEPAPLAPASIGDHAPSTTVPLGPEGTGSGR